MNAGINIRVKGTIKWFSLRKGFGFVAADDGRDYFLHHSGVDELDKRLLAGEKVEFEVSLRPDLRSYATKLKRRTGENDNHRPAPSA